VSWAGSLLNSRWRLGPRLGQGGQGRTYLARDEKWTELGERLVAVKELRLGEAGWKKFDLFEREARVLMRLDHPGIPRYLDRAEGENGLHYLVMERAPGETLKEIAARRRLTEAELRDVLDRVLDILMYLHGLEPPVVHRDIKPANLLLDDKGRVSLVDFGGVRDVLRDEAGSTVIGTFGYMAPEQLHGEATPRTDLYGLGATIVSLAGGIEPEKVPRKGLRMDLRRHLRALSPELVTLLEQLTEPDPDARPASAAAAKKILRARRRLASASGPVEQPQAVARVAAPPPAPLEPLPDEQGRAGQDFVRELDELAVPAPIKLLFRMFFGLVGIAAHVGLALVSMFFIPLAFTIARAVTGKEADQRLHAGEQRVQAVLKDTRQSFRALSRHAFNRRRQALPDKPELPRLPRRRR
jgi:serine/threonine protein kinase